MTARLANLAGRAVLVSEGRALDVEERSEGRLPADPMEVLARWEDLCAFAQELRASDTDLTCDAARAGPPVPRPAKVFGVGLNYRSHAEEAKLDVPDEPLIFTGTPAGIGGVRGIYLAEGDTIVSSVEGVGSLENRCVAGA